MIGKILKTMRLTKGLKQSEVSKLTNIPQNTISQYENEKIQPTFEIIEKLANIYNFKINFTNDTIVLNSKNINRKEIWKEIKYERNCN